MTYGGKWLAVFSVLTASLFLLGFFASKSLSTNCFYLLVLAGILAVFTSPVQGFAYKRWLMVVSLSSLIIGLSVIQYFVTKDASSYWDSAAVKFLWLIPGIGMIPFLDRDETPLQYAILLFLFTALLFHWMNGMSESGSEMIESRYAKLLAVIPIIFLIRKSRIKPVYIWLVFAAGAAASGVVAMLDSWFVELKDLLPLDEFRHVRRAAGNSSSVIFGGISLAMTVVTMVGLARDSFGVRRVWQKLVLLLSVMLGGIAVILSGSRGIWLAVPVLLVAGVYLVRHDLRAKHLALLSVFISLGVVVSVLVSFQSPYLKNRLGLTAEQLEQYRSSQDVGDPGRATAVGARLEMWAATWHMFITHPVKGIGPGNFNSEAVRLAGKQWHQKIADYDHPHNQYLTSLSSMGVLGLLTFMPLLLIPLWIFYRRCQSADRVAAAFALAGLLVVFAYLIYGLTVSPFERKTHIIFYSFTIACLLAMSGRVYAEKITNSNA